MPGYSDDLKPEPCHVAQPFFRSLCVALAAVLLASASLVANSTVAAGTDAPAARNEQAVDINAPVAFDIPAQALASALDAYSLAAHREVVYNGELAVGRRSGGVKGSFTPEAALNVLLEGTELLPRYMAADAFVLVVDDHPFVRVNTAPADVVMHYYGRIQMSLRQAFCGNRRTQPGDYRVAVGFRIGPSGAVSRAELLDSTGDRQLDAMITDTVRGLAIGAPPPQGFAQPVVLMVTPQSRTTTRDCNTTSAGYGAEVP
ncbi:MAG: TonB family protein [Ancalomicrobiaceae bacterium]|nr:TonB family protein [Ancalomicrobiaceae bacterium]